ncbi:hypothetical protein ASPZODRAFT_794889 [Penicilliopsis zonata CBS 506.65]|uniref:EF-hand domain-containing protein n=1 Tax=Penicilliopsis zonata CBS 506.65 TaxID=1073090 RepID=A0A1L9SBB7_9EURO|nr:hypothetical protein ASPZODRAFT_794889 [Penicilliopsis zonata CBS 506.65]OJJ44464.1 hypothetical protein ASPZODRAFT_794889 [Penicilliopsis zonata CBS 506.65]
MPRYTREEINQWKAVFAEMNTDGDRFLTPAEVIAHAKKEGIEMTDEQAKEYIDIMDVNKNGTVEFSEFIKALGERT